MRCVTGPPRLRCGSAGRTVAFANEVADPAAIDVERLFERFYRADASRSASGAGLGLAVSQSLAEAMGMRMTAHLEGNALIVEVELAGSLTAGGPV